MNKFQKHHFKRVTDLEHISFEPSQHVGPQHIVQFSDLVFFCNVLKLVLE